MGSGGFEVGAEVCGFERFRQVRQVVNQWFAACNDDEMGVCGFGLVGELGDRDLGVIFVAPGDFGVAPGAADIAEGETDEVGIGATPCAFALDGVESFDDRQGFSQHNRHHSRPKH